MVYNKQEQTILAIATKMKRAIIGCLLVYLVDCCLSLALSIVYMESYLNIIFSFMGLLLILGNISANRKDLKITSAYIILMSILLSLSLFAGVFTLIDGMTIWSQYQQVKTYGVVNVYPSSASVTIHNSSDDLLTQFALLLIIVSLHPILFLLNVYLLTLGARLRVNLLAEEKHIKEIQLRELVLKQVELQVMLLAQEPPSTVIRTKSQTRSKEKEKKRSRTYPCKKLSRISPRFFTKTIRKILTKGKICSSHHTQVSNTPQRQE